MPDEHKRARADTLQRFWHAHASSLSRANVAQTHSLTTGVRRKRTRDLARVKPAQALPFQARSPRDAALG
eukprot:6196828-Pleurochrysis_carterae.AAC.1